MELRQLGTALLELADDMDGLPAINTHDAYRLLTERLNRIQAAVPGNQAVIKARVAWYLHGLANFEEMFVRPTEQHRPDAHGFNQNFAGTPDSAPDLIMHPDSIIFYLRSPYIGENNFEVQERVIQLLERMLKRSRGKRRIIWEERLTLARRMR